mgnify:CR=1 FL=1
MKNVGVRHESEKKERHAQKAAMCGNVRVEHKNIVFENKTTKEAEVRCTPVAYIEDLTHFVPDILQIQRGRSPRLA